MHAPKQQHWQATKRILRYLAGTINHGLSLVKSSHLNLSAFCDSDWGSDLDDKNLQVASVFILVQILCRGLPKSNMCSLDPVLRPSIEACYCHN